MKKIFVNMDGVLCDKTDINNISLLNQEGYFYYKRPHIDVIESINLLQVNNNDVSVVILAPVPNNKAGVEVQRWLSYYMRKMVNVEVNFIPLGSSSVSICNVRDTNDILISNDAGDVLLWQAYGGKGIYLGCEDFSILNISTVSNKLNDIGIYKEINNAVGCRKIITLESVLVRLNLQYETGLSLYYEQFDNVNGIFKMKKPLNVHRDNMNYDSVDIDVETLYMDKTKIQLLNYLCENMYCTPIEYNVPGREKSVYLKFDMKKLGELDENGVEKYMEVADKRPVLYEYMKTEKNLQRKRYGGR